MRKILLGIVERLV